MISTKKDLDEYIEYETRDFKHRALLKVPFDLYESQIIAKFWYSLEKQNTISIVSIKSENWHIC